MTIYSLILDFIAEKAVFCSTKTIAYYSENIFRFLRFLGNDISRDISTVDKSLLDEYIYYLRGTGIKNVSINTYLRAVRVFLNWSYQKGYLEENFSQNLKFLKSDKSNILPLYQDEVKKIDSCFDFSSELGLRNYCIFHLMLDCGLRRNEVLHYSRKNIFVDKNVLSVLGKGNKYRLVLIPEGLKEKLMIYHELGYDDFKNCRKVGSISENTIKMMFSRLKDSSGVERLHPHLLRHTFATSYMIGGGNLEFLRMLMGHTDYDITRNYLHLANQFRMLGADIYRLDNIFFQKGY